MSDCLFCKIAAGEIPSNKVYEDETVYAFYDIDPQAPTHFLVIPKTHIGSVAEVTPENATVVAHIFAVISKVTKDLGLESYRVVSNIGEQAGQSVHHLHFHVLGGRDMTCPPAGPHIPTPLPGGHTRRGMVFPVDGSPAPQAPAALRSKPPVHGGWGPPLEACRAAANLLK